MKPETVIEQICNELQNSAKSLNKEKTGRIMQLLSSEPDAVRLWDLLESPAIMHHFAGLVDPDSWYTLGQHLLESDSAAAVRAYLDISRSTGFLKRIYGDRRWDDLDPIGSVFESDVYSSMGSFDSLSVPAD